MRKERLELAVQLCRQCLVMTEDQGRTLEFLNDIGHCEGLPRAGHAKQCNSINALIQSIANSLYRRRLVARRLIF